MENKLYHLLFIDDDRDFLRSMNLAISSRLLAKNNGVEIESHFLNDPNQALSFTQELIEEKETVSVIVSDQQMPKLTGIEFIEKANKMVPKAIKMLLTGYASIDSAKYAINHKILDQYVSKPIEDYDNFTCIIRNAIKTFHSIEEKELADQQIKNYVRELEEKNAKIKSMHLAAEKIAYFAQGFRKLDLDEVLDLIITKIPRLFNANYSSLFLLNQKKNSLEMVRSNHLTEPFIKAMDIPDRSLMMVALRENKIIVLPEIKQASYDYLDKEYLGDSCIVIPFILDRNQGKVDLLGGVEDVKGVLNMAGIKDMADEDVIKYSASLVQNILGINILNARLYQRTEKLAIFDGLTGLYNKNIFMEFLKKECEFSERQGNSFNLAIFDIDNFKDINDSHGHRVGDEALAHLGDLLRNIARKSDVFSRFGGDEFAMIIREKNLESNETAFERIRTEIFNSRFLSSLGLSISIGVASYSPLANDSKENLIDRADKALYRAKKSGKNRVEVTKS